MDERDLADLARHQRGYVTRAQLLELGLSEKAIYHRVSTRRLVRAYNGVYAVGHLPTLAEDQAVGALLACGDGAVLSHRSAASLWGIYKRWQMPFVVTVPGMHRRWGIEIHRGKLTRADFVSHGRLRVTTTARTVLDNAEELSDKALRRAVNDLRRSGHLSLSALAELLERSPRHPAARKLRPFVEASDGPTRSELEDTFLAFCERFGLPRPEINVMVAGREVDAWFPDERVIVELDGWAFHSDRGTFETDRDSDATALALGIVTVRLTYLRMKHRPEREAERLWKILRARRDDSYSLLKLP